MSWEVVQNFDISIISPIFALVCCHSDEWSMKIRIIPSINTNVLQNSFEIKLYYWQKK